MELKTDYEAYNFTAMYGENTRRMGRTLATEQTRILVQRSRTTRSRISRVPTTSQSLSVCKT